MYRSRYIIALGVFVGFLGLFWTKTCVGEGLAIFLLYLFLYSLILLLLARNAFNCVHLIQWLKLVACCPNEVSLVSRTSGYCWAKLRLVWLFKKLETRLN
jgi:hypothetical protein